MLRRKSRAALQVALWALVSYSSLIACNVVDDIDVKARGLLSATRDEMSASVRELEAAVERQRSGLAVDTQSIVQAVSVSLRGLADQADSSVRAVLSTGQSLEERATADLVESLRRVTSLSKDMTNAMQTGVDASIRGAAREFDKQRTISLQQVNAAAEGILRPALAQFRVVSGQLVGQVHNAFAASIVRAAGGGVLLIGASLLLVGVLKHLLALALSAAAVVALGGAVLLFAVPISSFGHKEIVLPTPESRCATMRELAARLNEFERPVAQPQLIAMTPEIAFGSRARTSPFQATPTDVHSDGHAPMHEPELLVPSDRVGLAQAVLAAANECIVWSESREMADVARGVFTRALAQLGDTVFCRTPADCAVLGKACDQRTQVCLARGVFCETHEDCKTTSQACDDVSNRCVDPKRPCTTPNDCAPEFACDRRSGSCVSSREIEQGQEPCTVFSAPANSPCQHGTLSVDDQRWVQCKQVGSAASEVCDGRDNNCNGQVDDGYVRAGGCNDGNGVGICRAQGEWTCANGVEVCVPAQASGRIETRCNGVDDDCNGVVDDVSPLDCFTSSELGECRRGAIDCAGNCRSVIGPSEEVCDGKDNDCDGMIDEAPACPLLDRGRDSDQDESLKRWSAVAVDEVGEAGDPSCGRSEHTGQELRREGDARVETTYAEHGASCAFEGWVQPDDDRNCRFRVRFKTKQWRSTAWCRVAWSLRPLGPWGG